MILAPSETPNTCNTILYTRIHPSNTGSLSNPVGLLLPTPRWFKDVWCNGTFPNWLETALQACSSFITVVRGGLVWSNRSKLTRTFPVGLLPPSWQWFEEVRSGWHTGINQTHFVTACMCVWLMPVCQLRGQYAHINVYNKLTNRVQCHYDVTSQPNQISNHKAQYKSKAQTHKASHITIAK